MHYTTIGIIGTAGRGSDAAKMTKHLFDSMLAEVERIVTTQLKLEWEDVMLVSGGAAWSGQLQSSLWVTSPNIFFFSSNLCSGLYVDHVAVQLNLIHDCGLTLFFPCDWDNKARKFVDTAGSDWRQNPGRNANRYHAKFMSVTGYNSFNDIQAVKETGAVIDTTHRGFHARNTAIAKQSEILIAFSWSKGKAPTDGGTFDTWKKCKARLKIHVSLQDKVFHKTM